MNRNIPLHLRTRVFLFSLLALPALTPVLRAIPITVGGIDYDVQKFAGLYEANTTLLQSQVWWGNATVANEFAAALTSDLNPANFSDYSPFFAYADNATPSESGFSIILHPIISAYWSSDNGAVPSGTIYTEANVNYWYATATAVPDGYSTLSLMLFAVTGMGFASWRRKPIEA